MKRIIFSDWNFFRILRLGIGIAIIAQAFLSKSWGIGILGVYFTILPLFNIGCCGAGNCNVPGDRSGLRKNSFPEEKSSI